MTREQELHIADWLDNLANHIRKGGSPYILNFKIPERTPDKPCKKEMIEEFSVTFSLPWGG